MKLTTFSKVLGLTTSLALGAMLQAAEPVATREPIASAKIVRKSAGLDAIIAADAKIEKIATGFVFTEGPMWHKGALWFSDLSGNKMYSLSADGKLKLMLDKAGGLASFPAGAYRGSNAMVANKDGSVLMMQHGARRIVQLDDKLNIKPFLEQYQGQQLNSPNDLVFAADGALYFTDPPFGFYDPANPNADLDKHPGHGLKFNGVYRYKDGQLSAVITDLTRPNGLAFSPDGKTFYVANSMNPSAIYKYDAKSDGTFTNRQLIADLTKESGGGVPDGMKVDSLGNLWTSGQGGFRIFSPKGELLGLIDIPEVAANVAWGANGKTAYFTGSTSIYKLPMKVSGNMPVYFFK
jgi:gluconolactonase